MRTDCSQLHIRDVDVTFNLYLFQDIAVVLRDKNRLNKVLRTQRPHSLYNSYEMAVIPIPVVVESSRSHKRVTDTEQVNEMNVMRAGRVVSERLRREEHEEYESGQSETSDEGEDFERIEYEELRQMEPREFKTKTEESFIEYFQKGRKMNKEVINRLLLGLFCPRSTFNAI